MTNMLLTVLDLQMHNKMVEFADFHNTSFTATRYSPGLSSTMARWRPGCRSAATWITGIGRALYRNIFPGRSCGTPAPAPPQDGHTGLSADPCRLLVIPLDRDRLGTWSGAPAMFLGEDHVGVTVGQHGRQVASLMPVRDQKRPAGGGIAQHPGNGTSRCAAGTVSCPGRHAVRARSGPLALRAEGDPSGEVREEGAGVEVVGHLGNGPRDPAKS